MCLAIKRVSVSVILLDPKGTLLIMGIECQSWRMRKSAVKHCPLSTVWSLHTWNHNNCSYRNKTCIIQNLLTNKHASGRELWGSHSQQRSYRQLMVANGGGVIFFWGIAIDIYYPCSSKEPQATLTKATLFQTQWVIKKKKKTIK